jgi:hypothetical protein
MPARGATGKRVAAYAAELVERRGIKRFRDHYAAITRQCERHERVAASLANVDQCTSFDPADLSNRRAPCSMVDLPTKFRREMLMEAMRALNQLAADRLI